ncbi:MAG: hypothetical protein WCK49_03210 [Myxococcaceae bacterium]
MNFKTLCFSFFISGFSLAVCNQLELDKNASNASFRHSRNIAFSWFKSHHSASDVITVEKHDANINAKFSYGPIGKDLEDEDVEVWIDTCGDKLTSLGTFKTDSDGRISPTLLSNQLPKAGAYRVLMRVVGDNTQNSFVLRIFEQGTQLAIFDFDGTLTYSDLNSNPRKGAPEITHAIKNLNKEIVYLSGRHYFLTHWTQKLLLENQFAEGSLIVGQSLSDIVPVESSVGEFKATYLTYLKSLGLVLERAYGNTETDVYAYQEVGIPNSQIFILGESGGLNGSVALGEGFLEHLQNLLTAS